MNARRDGRCGDGGREGGEEGRGDRGGGRRGEGSRRQGSIRRGRERSREVKDEDLPEAGYARGSRKEMMTRGREGGRTRRERERTRGRKRDARVQECLFEFLAKWPSVRSAGHPEPEPASQPAGVKRNHTDLHIMIYILVLSASSTLPPLSLPSSSSASLLPPLSFSSHA